MASKDQTKAAAALDAATAAPDPSKTPAGEKGETISVRGPAEGRWRAGRKFGREETTIDLSTLTVSQLKAIEGDLFLSVKRS